MWWIEANPSACNDLSALERNIPLQSGVSNGQSSSSHELGCDHPSANPTRTAPPADKGYDYRVLPPTRKLNGRQWFHLLFVQGVTSMLIAAALNFAIGYAMYSSPRPPPGPPPQGSIPPFLFSLPVSIVGDAALSTVFQTLITWYVLIYTVNYALSHGELQPYAPTSGVLAREPSKCVLRWFLFLDHDNAKHGSRVLGFGRRGLYQQGALVLAGLARAIIISAVAYGLMIGPAIGIMVAVGTPRNGDWVYLGRWDGTIFKTVFGGLMGLWMAPALSWMWMVRAGWIVRRHESLPA
ncbi:hypothetical protein N657DRAFT_669152 [Parathielavia appendiculata]|uniref:Uncharacterized protein n=1 Tax=Parathielavia appendiculata TaxID=2587402 RepID=A0AAN6U6C9_9PEZI|nr:hypothetical protein N657DRAFT_669152 [Parathielavia appendiculata]